jgi:hypothetical protein
LRQCRRIWRSKLARPSGVIIWVPLPRIASDPRRGHDALLDRAQRAVLAVCAADRPARVDDAERRRELACLRDLAPTCGACVAVGEDPGIEFSDIRIAADHDAVRGDEIGVGREKTAQAFHVAAEFAAWAFGAGLERLHVAKRQPHALRQADLADLAERGLVIFAPAAQRLGRLIYEALALVETHRSTPTPVTRATSPIRLGIAISMSLSLRSVPCYGCKPEKRKRRPHRWSRRFQDLKTYLSSQPFTS